MRLFAICVLPHSVPGLVLRQKGGEIRWAVKTCKKCEIAKSYADRGSLFGVNCDRILTGCSVNRQPSTSLAKVRRLRAMIWVFGSQGKPTWPRPSTHSLAVCVLCKDRMRCATCQLPGSQGNACGHSIYTAIEPAGSSTTQSFISTPYRGIRFPDLP